MIAQPQKPSVFAVAGKYIANTMIAVWAILPGTMLGYSHFTGDKLPLMFYYPSLEIFPIIFILCTGSIWAYVDIARGEASRGFLKTVGAMAVALVIGFVLEVFISYITWVPKHAIAGEPGFMALVLEKALWLEGLKDVAFLIRNPIAETFFFRIFLHRELACRFFPATDKPEEQLTAVTEGNVVLPRLSELGAWMLALSWGLYHIVPTILTNTPIFAAAGYTYAIQTAIVAWLCLLGRWFVHMRESCNWGILAQWAWHVAIDIDDVWVWAIVAKLTTMSTAVNLTPVPTFFGGFVKAAAVAAL